MGLLVVIVLCSAVATVISYVVTNHGTSPELGNLHHANHSPSLMFYAFLVLTVLLIVVPLLLVNIARAIRR